MIVAGLNLLNKLDTTKDLERKEKEKEKEKKRREEKAARLATLPTPFGSNPTFNLGLDLAFLKAFSPSLEM